ncbi:MAG: hypothetical protein LBM13_00665 [Candidatus Ancillula sp.]|jgi:hypothetical protein|nr:hypothetical protein [Candidatus Ancillula sp.]
MIECLILLAFILLSSLAFLLDGIYIWIGLTGLILILIFVIPKIRQNLPRFKFMIIMLSATLIITFFMNWWLDSLDSAILYTMRLFCMSLFSLGFCIIFGLKNLGTALTFLIREKKAKLSIKIGLALFPIMITWCRNFSLALHSKGFKISIKTLIKSPKIILNSLLSMFFFRLDQLELTLIAKGLR